MCLVHNILPRDLYYIPSSFVSAPAGFLAAHQPPNVAVHSDRALSGVSASPFRTVVSRDTRFVSAPANTPVSHDGKA
jgi:hypothetical protein